MGRCCFEGMTPFKVSSFAAPDWTSFRRGKAPAAQGSGCPSDTWVWRIPARYVFIAAGDNPSLARTK